MASKENAKKNRQRFPEPDEIVEALETAKREHTLEYEFACDLFASFVDPDEKRDSCPQTGSAVQINMAFTEWFLYDCDVFGGKTLFDLMAQDDPTLAECAQTQFYARFWVIKQDPERELVVLRDTATQCDRTVRSPGIARCKRWAKGTLGTRIACVRGTWVEIGQMTLHDNAPSKPLPPLDRRKLCGQHDPTAFIVNIEQLLGRNGIFAESMRCVAL